MRQASWSFFTLHDKEGNAGDLVIIQTKPWDESFNSEYDDCRAYEKFNLKIHLSDQRPYKGFPANCNQLMCLSHFQIEPCS